jgi:hypothetical protein
MIDSPLMTQATNSFIEYVDTNEVNALDQSIGFARGALASTVSSARVYCLHHLARCLSLRFEHILEIEDLSEAIRFLEEAASIPQEPSNHAVNLQLLARTFGDRYQANGDEHDFDCAIQAGNHGLNLGISDTSRLVFIHDEQDLQISLRQSQSFERLEPCNSTGGACPRTFTNWSC